MSLSVKPALAGRTASRTVILRRAGHGFIAPAAVLALLVFLLSLTALWRPIVANAAAPAMKLTVSSNVTNFPPGKVGSVFGQGPMYFIQATNVGGATTTGGPVTITDTLPAGLTPNEAYELSPEGEGACSIVSQTVSCSGVDSINPGEYTAVLIGVEVGSLSDGAVLTDEASVSGGGAAPGRATTATTISSVPASFGLLPGSNGLGAMATTPDGTPATQAGSHPGQLTVNLGFADFSEGEGFAEEYLIGAGGGVRDVHSVLPRGLIIDPSATSVRCTEGELESYSCPDASVVGVAETTVFFAITADALGTPLFNMVPPAGVPAELGFNAASSGIFIHIAGGVNPGDYSLSAKSNDILSDFLYQILGVQLELWGDPSSPSHDHVRGTCAIAGYGFTKKCPVPAGTRPFITMPSACSDSLRLDASVDSWSEPGNFLSRSTNFSDGEGNQIGVTGCEKLDFTPSISLLPDTTVADSPSGLHVDLKVPQNEDVNKLAEANLKDATVALPAGMTVSPSAANGLAGCSEAQIGLGNGNEPACPDASKIGSVEVQSPLLSDPLKGSVYIAQQGNLPGNGSNPFGSLLAIYVTAEADGALIKLAGKVSANPATGHLTTTFLENPELPFSDFKLDFYGGPHAALATPSACGTYQSSYALAPWSGTAPVTGNTPMTIDQGCAAAGFAPSFVAGTLSNSAGSFSPLELSFSRNDTEQQIKALQVTLPPGASAKLAGVPLCSDADANAGTCPEASRIGTVAVRAGVGSDPFSLAGRVYLTGAYNGGPYGEAVVVPAVAGPLNLGNVVVRGSIRIDPHTAQPTVVSDPFPQFIGSTGIPADVRSVQVTLDRPGFTFNPTSCKTLNTTGVLTSVAGASEAVSSRFQAADCRALSFKPVFQASTLAKSSRKDGAALHVVLRSGPGQANVGYVHVSLPKILPSRLTTLQKACPDNVFRVNPASCPAASRVGEATARTPVLAHRLQGPAYFVSHGGAAFPDLVVVLQGEGITVDLVGNTAIKKNVTSSTFASPPDVPVTRFDLTLPMGPNSALAAVGKLCKERQKLTMPTKMIGQNGAVLTQTTKIAVAGCPKAVKQKRK